MSIKKPTKKQIADGLRINRLIAKQYMSDLSKFYEIAARNLYSKLDDNLPNEIRKIVDSANCTRFGLLRISDDIESILKGK